MTERNADYVEFGSDKHAMMLGLRKAGKSDSLELEGWTLEDLTAFGPQAMGDDMAYLREILRQKMNTLTSGPPPAPQSDDPLGAHYAPPLLEEPVLDYM